MKPIKHFRSAVCAPSKHLRVTECVDEILYVRWEVGKKFDPEGAEKENAGNPERNGAGAGEKGNAVAGNFPLSYNVTTDSRPA